MLASFFWLVSLFLNLLAWDDLGDVQVVWLVWMLGCLYGCSVCLVWFGLVCFFGLCVWLWVFVS